MRRIGGILALAGLFMSVASMVLFGRTIQRGLQARLVDTVPMELGKEATTGLLDVDADRSCQVAIKLAVDTASVEEETQEGGARYTLRYSFPYTYKVTDAKGGVVFAQEGSLRWDNGVRIISHAKVGASGGTARVQFNLAKFEVPPPGQIKVDATVSPDTQYGAQAANVELRVYDDVSRHTPSMVVAGILVLFGPAVMITGAILYVIAWAQRVNAAADARDALPDADGD